MTEHQPRNAFDIPKLFYFQAKNVHSGSRGKMRYRICPENDMLSVAVWRKDLCYELVTDTDAIEAKNSFPLSEDGFQAMLDWLAAEFAKTT
ncbi:MAG: hypothetical protein ACI4J3_02420 [Oscillospiraceae bacterium]